MGSLDVPTHVPQQRKNSASQKYRSSLELQTIDENGDTAGLDKLKRVTTRLQLSTRRPSILEWQESVKQSFLTPRTPFINGNHGTNGDEDDVINFEERKEHIDSALEWLRTELKAMKTQDHMLAMQLMRLRADIQQIKLQKTSSEHQDLIDNSAYSVEEESELKSGLYDALPILMPTNSNNNDYEHMSIVDKPLKDMGVTRMNLSRRRFSLR